MNTTIGKNILGAGIYTVPEISTLLGFPQAKVRRYLHSFWDDKFGKKLFNKNYTWVEDKTVAVNFYVLIELYIFFQLQELGVKTSAILTARENICRETGLEYPFATKVLLTDGREIYYRFKDALVKANGTKQSVIEKILKDYLKKIEFDEHKVAKRFFPNGKKSCVVVDPHHQFGQPTIKGTNITIDAIWSMYKSGEKKETLKYLYDLSPKQINDIVGFAQKAA
jgi:uncharacterized protein (DUF433 family)